MMAPTCRHHFLTERLVSFVIMTLISCSRGNKVQLKGEVGGNVTFPCLTEKQGAKEFVYLQRGTQGGTQFVNGYHVKGVRENTWPNTEFNHEQSSVFMYDLNLSHSGEYSCHIRYNDSTDIAETIITLSVTAKYSRPTVTSPVCGEQSNPQSCHVTCRSYGGYPKAQMIFQVVVGNTSNQIWDNVKSVEDQNSSTKLFDSFSTASYNCSGGEIKFRCSVDDVASDQFVVCAHPEPHSTLVIGAAICIVVVVVVTTAVVCYRRRTADTGRRARLPTNDDVEIATAKEAA